jgi:hypothetical protein
MNISTSQADANNEIKLAKERGENVTRKLPPLIILCTDRRRATEYTGMLFHSVGDWSTYNIVTDISELRGLDVRGKNVISLESGALEKYCLEMGGIVYRLDDSPIREYKMAKQDK